METNKPKLPLIFLMRKRWRNSLYEIGILHYKIIGYKYISPDDKISEISKTGWIPIREYNFEHPYMKKKIAELQHRQEESLARKNVDWERLNKIHITI